MSKEEIVKTIETRLEMLHENYEATQSVTIKHRIDELETLLNYIENPRIK